MTLTTHQLAFAMGLTLAFTWGEAFIAPIPGACPPNPSLGSAVNPVVSSRGVQTRTSSVPALELSTGFSFGSLVDLIRGSNSDATTLPQDPEADTAARKKELKEKKDVYEWNFEGIPVGTPYLDGLPSVEIPSLSWIVKTASSFVKIILGTIGSTIGPEEVIEAITDSRKTKTFIARVRELINDTYKDQRPVDINDYEDLHSFPVKTPDSVYDWEEDEVFARLRLQGANCVVISKCTDAQRAKLTILDTDPSYKDLKQKVDSLIKAGKLFVVDHEMLNGMKTTKLDETFDRYLATGIALFEVVDDELLPLRPLGIQLTQGETATPIFTPEDPEYTWKIAKACFEAADFIVHEVVSHLGFTHVVLEGALVSVNRCFPEAHPIYKLMKPHFEGTAFINWGAQNILIETGGAVDRFQANDIEESWALVLEKVLERIENDFSPPEDFAARKMTTEDFPGRYPYRDIGTMYWDAIYTWVDEYLAIYYTSEADVEGDYELKEFVDEMVNKAAFKWLNGFYDSSDKRGMISEVLATLIYTASVMHAAVNFPQMPSMSFTASCPGSMYVPILTDKRARTFEEFLAYLPGLEIAAEQVSVTTLLGSIFHTELGDYEGGHFSDNRVMMPLAKFQEAIETIGTEIADMNAAVVSGWRQRGLGKREAANFAYSTLLPEKVPQSTNI